jgi:molybdopterin converting factor small subunit
MRVDVRLFATLAVYLPFPAEGAGARIEVPDGSTVGQVIRRLGIPDEFPRITLLNGLDADPEQPLHEGDTVSVFPPLAGGA